MYGKESDKLYKKIKKHPKNDSINKASKAIKSDMVI